MRNIILYIAFLLLSCNAGGSKYNEPEIIEKVKSLTQQYNKVWETLNTDQIAAFHSEQSFLYYWHGGLASSSNDHFKKLFHDILSGVKAWSIKKTSEPVVQVIAGGGAVISFSFEAESTGQDDKKTIETGALTYVWKEFNGQWNIILIHESAK